MKFIAPVFLTLLLAACTGSDKPETGTTDVTDNDNNPTDTDTTDGSGTENSGT